MNELNLGIDIKAPAEKVYAALTDPAALTHWFAEHADIALDHNRFDFWGRNTPGAPNRADGSHKLRRAIENKLIEFDWRLRGVDSVVQFEIHKSGDNSVLTMHHSNMPQAAPNQSSIGDFWSHSLECLRHWLEKGKSYQLLDYATEQRGDVRIDIDINVAPALVFEALTVPTQMNRWIGSKGSIEPKPGGKIDFGWGMGPTKILEIIPEEKLSYTWEWEGEVESITTWTLEGSGDKTHVTIVQSGFAPDRDSEDYYIGWCKFAARLKAMLEEGPEWERVKVYANRERAEALTTTIDVKENAG